MNEILVGILVLVVVITAAYLVSLIIELKKTLRSVDTLLKTTEQTLKPTLEELQQTLRNLNNISDNINEVTTDVKTLSGSVKNVGLTIQQVGGLSRTLCLQQRSGPWVSGPESRPGSKC